MFWGGFLLVIFCIFLLTGKFEIRSGAKVGGGRRTTYISRQDDPLIYWGTESFIFVVATSLFSIAVYRAREGTDVDEG
jgi:hypothetical protein